MRDGLPVYGFCKTTTGDVMRSCFKLKSSANTGSVSHVSGTYTDIGSAYSDYAYDSASYTAGACDLDQGNGAIHPITKRYSYFMTYSYPWVPIYFYGSEGVADICSAA